MFYQFSQNNSGGRFKVDRNVAEYVIIEANGAQEANDRALEIGIYFDGVSEGRDCPCCGSRWSEASSYDGTETPTVYGTPVESYKPNVKFTPRGEPLIHVYYLSGEKKTVLAK